MAGDMDGLVFLALWLLVGLAVLWVLVTLGTLVVLYLTISGIQKRSWRRLGAGVGLVVAVVLFFGAYFGYIRWGTTTEVDRTQLLEAQLDQWREVYKEPGCHFYYTTPDGKCYCYPRDGRIVYEVQCPAATKPVSDQ